MSLINVTECNSCYNTIYHKLRTQDTPSERQVPSAILETFFCNGHGCGLCPLEQKAERTSATARSNVWLWKAGGKWCVDQHQYITFSQPNTNFINNNLSAAVSGSVGTDPKKWDPGITALLTNSWNWDPDPDPDLTKESDLSKDPDLTDIQIMLPNKSLQKNTILLAKHNMKMHWDKKNYVILRDL